MNRFTPPLALSMMLVAGAAFAHPGHGGGLAAGLAHPFTGFDHLLAMLAVGIWAAQQTGRTALWQIPLAFVGMMAIGVAWAAAGMILPQFEVGIAVSLIVLGLLLAFALRLPRWAGMALVAGFALWHGFAHGVTMPLAGAGAYLAGLLLATVAIHALGVGLGLAARRRAALALRLGGAGVALVGAWLALA